MEINVTNLQEFHLILMNSGPKAYNSRSGLYVTFADLSPIAYIT